MKLLYSFFFDCITNRNLIFLLVKQDFRSQYIASYLGIAWAYIHPIVFLGVLYSVFTLGFRSPPNRDGLPFVVYLVTSISAWFFFANMLNSPVGVFKQYSFLVRRSGFPLLILPVVKLFSSLLLHLFFLLVVFGILIIKEIPVTLCYIQIFYYIFAVMIFMTGVGWLVSSVSVFIPDIQKLLPLIVQVGFWFTPVFWDISSLSKKMQFVFKLNPAFYIVNGYRETFLYNKWFWDSPYLTVYFWFITFIFCYIGSAIFKRMSAHFVEVV